MAQLPHAPHSKRFRSWTRVRHLSYGRCETNNPQSRCLEGAGLVSSLLGVDRRTPICQSQRINWTRKALLFSHAGSLHGAAGCVCFMSACLTLQSNLALDVNPGSKPGRLATLQGQSRRPSTPLKALPKKRAQIENVTPESLGGLDPLVAQQAFQAGVSKEALAGDTLANRGASGSQDQLSNAVLQRTRSIIS